MIDSFLLFKKKKKKINQHTDADSSLVKPTITFRSPATLSLHLGAVGGVRREIPLVFDL